MDDITAFADERAIRRVVDLLFHHTDDKAWAAGVALYIEGPIKVDMTSLVGASPSA